MGKLNFIDRFTPNSFPTEMIHSPIDRELYNVRSIVRQSAVRSPKATKEHLDKAITDTAWVVHKAVASHPKATKEHLDKALRDKSEFVRNSAYANPCYPNRH